MQRETYGHVQSGCAELKDTHHTAHKIIAEVILGEIQKAADHLEVKAECMLGEWHTDCPLDMGAIKPDA